jgi:hypothetical protein
MAKIDAYEFGAMTVEGQVYRKDLIIFPDKVRANWWRKSGHSLDIGDLNEVIKVKPELLVVGTGASGCMQTPFSTKLELRKNEIELIEEETPKAARVFNEQVRLAERLVVGAFHLTC